MKSFLPILVLLTSIFCNAQGFTKCIVYQFAGTDSNKKHISLTQTFNRRGQVVSETYSNYKRSSAEGNSDGIYHYYYNDTLLVKQLFIAVNNDTTKMLCYYNGHNQLIKEEYFSCERRLRRDLQKGLGQSGGCVVFDTDFEKNRTWMKANEVKFLYDDKGRRIKKIDEQDYTRLWQYDKLNRIIQEKGYEYNKLAYSKDYQYSDGGYNYSTIYYDENEMPETPRYSDVEFNPIYTYTFYVNKKGKISKEEITTEKGTAISSEIIGYDNNGRIVKTVYLDGKGRPEITHLFEYK